MHLKDTFVVTNRACDRSARAEWVPDSIKMALKSIITSKCACPFVHSNRCFDPSEYGHVAAGSQQALVMSQRKKHEDVHHARVPVDQTHEWLRASIHKARGNALSRGQVQMA